MRDRERKKENNEDEQFNEKTSTTYYPKYTHIYPNFNNYQPDL